MENTIGFSISMDYERPEEQIWQKLKGIPSTNIDDCMGRLYGVGSNIKNINNKSILGPALTVKCPGGDNLMIYQAIELAQPKDILVIKGISFCDRAFLGEIMLRRAIQKGIAGIIVDGLIRDIDAMRGSKIPIFASGVSANGAYHNGPGEINKALAFGDQVICPGDIISGDNDGLVVIPKEYLAEIVILAKANYTQEQKTFEHDIEKPKWLDSYYK